MIDRWQQLLTHEAELLAHAAAMEAFDPAGVARLRKRWDAPLVSCAIELVCARRKAQAKFDGADRLVADVAGVEQATGGRVAAYKAGRFVEAGVEGLHDLCCGIGGDAMALAKHMAVTLVDRDPLRVWMAQRNVEAVTGREPGAIVADVATLGLRDEVFHLDPARRRGDRRTHRYEDYQPGPAFIDNLLTRCPDGAVKLGPGVELDALPAGEVEMISDGGTLVQAVLWCGRLVRHERAATLLPAGVTLAGAPMRIPIGRPGKYLHTVDPAVERAGLIGNLCEKLGVVATHPKLGLLTGDGPLDSPWVTGFEHVASMPWRLEKVGRYLAERDAGLVEVKTRGGAVDPDVVQKQLRGAGGTPYTLFVLRYDQRVVAHVARRLA